ncbi:hypothetical protein BS47DRAFT_1367066 [Hydnum rufescens UP504]|uniref:Uncharacterized protein n=1 Tax=Hydnum rufescens UP504 TaxID=1448309 RepID=A0A9P6DQP4_9AGAM|nr:hypothetical protein BS47DRAFT_1367066 [Hydnum rufescens UP504]
MTSCGYFEWADPPINNPTQSLTPPNTPTSSRVLHSTPGRPRSTARGSQHYEHCEGDSTVPNSPTKHSKLAAGIEDLMEILNNVLAGVTEVRGCLKNDVHVIKQQQTETESKIAEMDDRLCALEDIVEAITRNYCMSEREREREIWIYHVGRLGQRQSHWDTKADNAGNYEGRALYQCEKGWGTKRSYEM